VAARRWEPESREAVEAAIAAAMSIEQCAGSLGCSENTLRNWCKSNGVDFSQARRMKPAREPWAPQPGQWEEVRGRATSITEAAQLLGVQPLTLRKWAARVGIDLAGLRSTGGVKAAPRPPELDPGERVEHDTAHSRIAQERDTFKRLYDESIVRIRTQEDMWESIADRFTEPRHAPVFTRKPHKASALPRRTAVLILSDWQLGELVDETETGGMNSYSWAQAVKRCGRLVEAVIGNLENQMRAYRIDRLVIAVLGDIVEGHDIFNGQPWSLDKDAAMQSVDGADLMASVLTAVVEPFLPHGLQVDIYCVPGNHGKPGGRKAGQTPVTFSFDLLLYEMLRRQLTNWPVHEFAVEPAGRLLFMAADQVCLMTHGNEVRGWGGFPYYGLDKVHARMTMELETLFTHWLLGHWHSAATLPAGRGMRVVNGTMVGANQLTQAAVLTTSAPSQTMLYMSRELGLAEVAYLVLEPGHRKEPTIYGSEAA
jgi:hypothetical protein